MITKHPTLPNKYLINFDLSYKFEDDHQIHVSRSVQDNPPSGIGMPELEHLLSAINRMAAELRFYMTLQGCHVWQNDEKCEHESDGMIYCSNPPQNKCTKCGEFYR